MSHESPPTPPDREHRRKAIEALPIVGDMEIVESRAALAALSDIKNTNPKLYAQIRGQIKSTQQGFAEAFEDLRNDAGNFVLSRPVLNAVIARSIIAGAAQTGLGLGEATLHVNLLREITNLWQAEIETGPETGPETEALEEGEA